MFADWRSALPGLRWIPMSADYLPPISLRRFEFSGGKAPFFAVSDTDIFFLGLVLPVSFFVQRANRYHDMGMGIVPGRIWIMDSNIGALLLEIEVLLP